MRLAIISDIHGNLHALEAVWADLRILSPDAVICLGDLVGYGAYPNEVIDFVRGHGVPVLMGNYDDGVGKPKDGDARAAYLIADFEPKLEITPQRVTYDVAAAGRAVRESGLPTHFADLLETGGLPPEATRLKSVTDGRARPPKH